MEPSHRPNKENDKNEKCKYAGQTMEHTFATHDIILMYCMVPEHSWDQPRITKDLQKILENGSTKKSGNTVTSRRNRKTQSADAKAYNFW